MQTGVHLPLTNSLVAHSRTVFNSLNVNVKNCFHYRENEWDDNFRVKWKCAVLNTACV